MSTIGLTAPKTYTQTVPGAAVAPSTTTRFDVAAFDVMIRELVASRVIEEPVLQRNITSAQSFFNGNSIIQDQEMLNNLQFGQELRVIVEKEQNPMSLFNKKAMAYREIDTCHQALTLDCTVPCVNTLPEFNTLKFRFDTEYSYGVRACDKNKKFWDLEYFTRQYAKSRYAYEFGREVDLWNTVVKGLIAAPATTVDAALAKVHATHYWENLGSVKTNARETISQAAWYMQTNFAYIDPKIIMPVEMAKEIIESQETAFGLNTNFQKVNTFAQWDVPGYMVDEQVRQILGTQVTVLIMERSPWLVYNNAGTLASTYPLWNATGTKQYCAIVDPKVGYQFETEGYHLVIKPYDCDKLTNGMVDTVYTGSGITFPVYGMILEFDAFTYV